jgi:putative transposase
MICNLAHKIKLNPTLDQVTYFRQASGVARKAYNWGLENAIRIIDSGGTPNFLTLKKKFNEIKGAEFPYVYDVTKCATEQEFVNLKTAFTRYDDICKGKIKIITNPKPRKDGRPKGFPRFKSKKRDLRSFYLSNDQFAVSGHCIRVPKLGWVNMAEELRFSGKVMSATISEYAGNWYVSISTEFEIDVPLNGRDSVGLDLGITKHITLSGGRGYFDNIRVTKNNADRVRKFNKQLSRREFGSNRYFKAKVRLQKAHERIHNVRLDRTHKITNYLVRNYEFIGIEDLNVAGMVRNKKRAKSIQDVSFYEIRRQLEYKQHIYGSIVQPISQWYPSSKTCSGCGWYNPELKPGDTVFICQECGSILDRDENAANNIEYEAIRLFNESSGTGQVRR